MKQTPARPSARAAGDPTDDRAGHVDHSPRRRTLWGDPDALMRALRATLADECFVASPRTSRLLVHLVVRTIAGDAEPLRGVRISRDTFDADADDAALLRILLARLERLLAERRARVGDRVDVLKLAPLGYVVVERAAAPAGGDDGVDGDGAPHRPARESLA